MFCVDQSAVLVFAQITELQLKRPAVESEQVSGQVLARRLRALREEHWPDARLTQPKLALALGGVSVPLISSWESSSNPKIPPPRRLADYATFFATRRSLEGGQPHLLRPEEMTEAERQVKDDLTRELMRLRNGALHATVSKRGHEADLSPDPGLWRFDNGRTVTIVCAQLPSDLLERMPYTKRTNPDYIELYTYADLDALFELHGYLRATNPETQVNLRAAHSLTADDYSTHMVPLGGVDWNVATKSVLDRLELPVKQISDWDSPEGSYFAVGDGDEAVRFYPYLDRSEDDETLLEDVAMFARAINPYNHQRTVTMCNGMYGSGTYGAVRALTDKRFRDRNTEYIRSRFAGRESFGLLTRVAVVNGVPLTPDWTLEENILFEWPEPPQ